ncbi:MAG: FG-GAP-like repeat-containing protein [Fidelibacterota bacterium]
MNGGRRLVLVLALFLLGGCLRKPAMDAGTVTEMIRHRNLGLAYLEEGNLQQAKREFQELVEIAPREPLGYANLGLTHLRMTGELQQAETWLKKALKLEPDHPDIRLLLAKVYELRHRKDLAVRTLENSLKRHSDHVRTLHQLAEYLITSPDPGLLEKAEGFLVKVVNALPANVAARLQLAEVFMGNGKLDQAVGQMVVIRQILPELPEGSRDLFERSLTAMNQGNINDAMAGIRMFQNVLQSTSVYRAAVDQLKGIGGEITGVPIRRFVQPLPLQVRRPSGIPVTVKFMDVTDRTGLGMTGDRGFPSEDDLPGTVLAAGDYDGDGDPDLFVSRWRSDEQTSRQYLYTNDKGFFEDKAGEAGIAHGGRDVHGVFADVNNDGHIDLFVTNSSTNKLYLNSGQGAFEDATASSGIQTVSGERMALFIDLDHEGDLDLFIAGRGQNRLYRNNSDKTFSEIGEEAGVRSERALAHGRDAVIGDFDDDGDMDLFVISEEGNNQYYDNLRQGYFRDILQHTGLASRGSPGAVTAGDYNNDGYLDLFVADLEGQHHSLFRNLGDGTFDRDSRSDSTFEHLTGVRGLDAVFLDADNDGFQDLLIAGTPQDTAQTQRGLWLFHNTGEGRYVDASSLLPGDMDPATQVETVDYDGDGDLDILLVDLNGSVRLLRNDGGNVNNYLAIRLAGLRSGGSRNNYFGIGAKVEVKAGTLYQMRVMTEPVALFGLGDRDGADVVRVVWSNGVPQNRFNPERNQTILETQVLKGSCPWLYAWNGDHYEFVTDVLWASALGMPLGIMAGERIYAFANSAREYFKIPGEKLKLKDGTYSLQFTTELWETPYLDQVKLLVIDHRKSVDVFVDETFTLPPFPPLHIYGVNHKHLPVSAHDGFGNDVLEKISQRDTDYVSNLIPALHQGVTEPHDLILDLGEVSHADSIFLFLQGWVFPTDASINVNMAQSGVIGSVPPSLQVIDEQGNWKTVIENLGFPKGKKKTMVVDLTGKFLDPQGRDSRIRIRTSMQIFWDHIFYATGSLQLDPGQSSVITLNPGAAHLHYRGFSEVNRESPYSPHIPNYQIVTTEPKWRDLTGFYTRFGDVLPLLLDSDGKYVVMNAGDELTLEFDATGLPDPPAGWTRDFLFYNDGWLKDGDLNTAYGQTVNPLPFHGMSAYPYGPDESFPRDEEHASYLQTYNTREITTWGFKRSLLTFQRGDQ